VFSREGVGLLSFRNGGGEREENKCCHGTGGTKKKRKTSTRYVLDPKGVREKKDEFTCQALSPGMIDALRNFKKEKDRGQVKYAVVVGEERIIKYQGRKNKKRRPAMTGERHRNLLQTDRTRLQLQGLKGGVSKRTEKGSQNRCQYTENAKEPDAWETPKK